MNGWHSWHWDAPTALWLLWIVWFFVQESVALFTPVPLDTLTAHLRPIIQAHPLAWFLGAGVWFWMGFHFLVEGLFVVATGNG